MSTAPEFHVASTTAPVNIAVIKYWGKRHTALNLPTNSSLSVTLSQRDLRTLTTACCSPSFTQNRLWLNSEPQDISGPRQTACFTHLKSLRAALESADPSLPKLSRNPVHIVSENNFPTAAGLASSAAGFAALVRAIADLYQLPQNEGELSKIARQGSGSACRSLFGGYVAWEMGSDDTTGDDSYAVQVAPASHWPEMRAAILVVSDKKKGVSSTAGMQATVKTSTLFKERAEKVVPHRMEGMKKAILERDFETFAELTMRDSNGFHAVCLDTTPPIFYLNDVSRNVIMVVEELNKLLGRKVAAYTFDAGPNAVIYYEEKNEDVVLGALKGVGLGGATGLEGKEGVKGCLPEGFDQRLGEVLRTGISRVILTGVGEGPVSVGMHLVGADGLPLGK